MATPAAKTNTCPGCGEAYILGAETCDNCQFDLSRLPLPATEIPAAEAEFGTLLTEVRLGPAHELAPADRVAEAVALLRDDPAGAVIVMDAGRIAGIFTERDVLKHVADRPGVLQQAVSQVMTPDPVILRDTDTVATALNKMTVGGFRHIPLVHGDQLVGVVNASDLMQWFMQRYFD